MKNNTNRHKQKKIIEKDSLITENLNYLMQPLNE